MMHRLNSMDREFMDSNFDKSANHNPNKQPTQHLLLNASDILIHGSILVHYEMITVILNAYFSAKTSIFKTLLDFGHL